MSSILEPLLPLELDALPSTTPLMEAAPVELRARDRLDDRTIGRERPEPMRSVTVTLMDPIPAIPARDLGADNVTAPPPTHYDCIST